MQRKPFIAAIAFAILVSVGPLIAQDVPGMQFQKEEIPTGKNVLAVGAHQNRIVTVLEDGEVIQNDLGKTDKVGEIAGRPVSVAASDQTDHVGIVTDDGLVHVLSAKAGISKRLAGTVTDGVAGSAFDGDGNLVVLTPTGRVYRGKDEDIVLVADLNLGQPLALFPNGRFAVGLDADQGMCIKRVSSQEILQLLPVGERPSSVSVSSDNRYVAVAQADSKFVEIWDLATRKHLKSQAVPGKEKVRLAISAGALVSVDKAGQAYFTDLESGETVEKSVSPFPDGNTLANLVCADRRVLSITKSGTAEKLEVFPSAAAQPSDEYFSVPVYFATNRALAKPITFGSGFASFFWSVIGLVAIMLVLGVTLLVALLPGATRWRTLFAFGVSVVVLLLMAGVNGIAKQNNFDPKIKNRFGAEPSTLSFGQCTVTVPKNHRIGQLESPFSLWVLRGPEDPSAHVIVQDLNVLSVAEFRERVSDHAESAAEARKSDPSMHDDSLLFIHGYNVSFEDAVRSTAQLSVDLGFKGPPICFSWPSFAETLDYGWDSTNAENSTPALLELLKELAGQSKLRRTHIIAHSMGNRILARALADSSTNAIASPAFPEVVLAAPDIDRTLFASQLAPILAKRQQHVTLYASARDRALLASKYFNGFPRAGDTQPEITIIDHIDSVDASAVDTSFLGHSYYAEERSLITDLYYLLGLGLMPNERFGLERGQSKDGVFWLIQP